MWFAHCDPFKPLDWETLIASNLEFWQNIMGILALQQTILNFNPQTRGVSQPMSCLSYVQAVVRQAGTGRRHRYRSAVAVAGVVGWSHRLSPLS